MTTAADPGARADRASDAAPAPVKDTGSGAQRWSLRYHADRVTMEPAENGCRSYPCCNGEECGYSFAEARAEIVSHRERELERLKSMSDVEFLSSQGY